MYRNKPLVRTAIHAGLLLLALILLASCAKLSLEECKFLDWEAKGYMDGLEGQSADQLSKYQQSCSRFGITVDAQEYEKGRSDGLDRYCTTANGNQVGLTGKEYRQVCPTHTENDFLIGYIPARKLWSAHNELRSSESTANSSRYTVQNLENRIDRLQEEMRDADNEEERSDFAQRIRDVEREISEVTTRAQYARFSLPVLRQKCQEALVEYVNSGFPNPPFTCY